MNIDSLDEFGIDLVDAKISADMLITVIDRESNPSPGLRWICAQLEELRDNCEAETEMRNMPSSAFVD